MYWLKTVHKVNGGNFLIINKHQQHILLNLQL